MSEENIKLLKSIENNTITGLSEYIEIQDHLLKLEKLQHDEYDVCEIIIEKYQTDEQKIKLIENCIVRNDSIVINFHHEDCFYKQDNKKEEEEEEEEEEDDDDDDEEEEELAHNLTIYGKSSFMKSIGILFSTKNIKSVNLLISSGLVPIGRYFKKMQICLNKINNTMTDLLLTGSQHININYITNNLSYLILHRSSTSFTSEYAEHCCLPNSLKYFKVRHGDKILIYPSKITYLHTDTVTYNKKFNNLKYLLLTKNHESSWREKKYKIQLFDTKLSVFEVNDEYDNWSEGHYNTPFISKNMYCDTLIVKQHNLINLDEVINKNIKNLIILRKYENWMYDKRSNTSNSVLNLHSLSVVLHGLYEQDKKYLLTFPESKAKLVQSIGAVVETHKRYNIQPRIIYNSSDHIKYVYSNNIKKSVDIIITFNGKVFFVKTKNEFNIIESAEDIKHIIENYFYNKISRPKNKLI